MQRAIKGRAKGGYYGNNSNALKALRRIGIITERNIGISIRICKEKKSLPGGGGRLKCQQGRSEPL
jgi:hypothetical protein